MIGKVLRIRYEVIQSIHDGPIFTLYSAKDRVHSKEVFIRVLKGTFANETDFVDGLKAVVAKMANVQHPGIERILEMDEDDGIVFLVSESSTGTTLSDRIKKLAPFSVPVSVSTAIGICEALSAVHSAFAVHGDVGPHNVFISQEGDVRLQMAGIWESYSGSSTAGSVVLPALAPYLAPEVSRGGMPSPASDMYSIGVILFELLAGRKPFIAEYPVAVAMMHATEPTPEVRVLNPSVPVALNEIIKKAMSKDPGDRYRSAAEMLSDLRMVRDALRFGRSLTWPPGGKTAEEEAQASPVPPGPSGAKAPKESPKPSDRWVEEIDEGSSDIPTWLKMTMVFFGSLVVFMVGGWILFNLSKPKLVEVPALQRLSLAQAKTSLDPLKLNLRIAQRVSNEQIPAEGIIESYPPAGTKVYERSTIDVTVSAGSKFVEVPDLRGLAVDRAKALLDTLGLRLDDRVNEVRDREVEAGLIVGHTPERGNRVERNTKIRVRVSIGNRREAPEAEPKRKFLYTVSIRLTDVTEPVNLRVDLTDSEGTKTVHESMASPDELVEIAAEGYGPEVVFRIFYDGEMVKQVTKRADEDGQEPPAP